MRCAPRASNGPNHLGLCALHGPIPEQSAIVAADRERRPSPPATEAQLQDRVQGAVLPAPRRHQSARGQSVGALHGWWRSSGQDLI